MRYGDKYLEVLGKGMKTVSSVKNFDLSNNRMTEVSSNLLIKNISSKAIRLDLSYNKIGKLGM